MSSQRPTSSRPLSPPPVSSGPIPFFPSTFRLPRDPEDISFSSDDELPESEQPDSFPVDKDGNTPLHHSCKKGDLQAIYSHWSAGGSLEMLNRRKDTPLHIAASMGHVGVVRFLGNVGADIEARNSRGWTALHWAVFMEKPHVVKELLSQGASVRARDKKGKTVLDMIEDMQGLPLLDVREIARLLSVARTVKFVPTLKKLCIKKLVGRKDHQLMVEYIRHVHSRDFDKVET